MPPPKDPKKYALWLTRNSESHKGHPAWNKGQPLSPEHRKNLSLSKTGIPSPRKGVRAWPNGLPKYVTDKISAKLKGKKQSADHISKRIENRMQNIDLETLRQSAKQMGYNNRGRKHNRSETHIANLSKSIQSYWKSEEGIKMKKTLSDMKKGIPRPIEIQKILKENRANQKFPIEDTKPERMMQIALALNGIEFEKQKLFRFNNTSHAVDIFIEPNICVEVDGDHWHANPSKYDSESLIIGKRKAKDVWARDIMINHELSLLGNFVIRIWVSDIKKNTQGCAEKIIKSIKERKEIAQI